MNFLAHLYLSGNFPKIMVGNFIGDFVKGRNLAERYEPEIALGIELHRSIDDFTDRHPSVKESKNRLRPKYRHYSGVIIDVFYDHFLARNWDRFHHLSLAEFASSVYALLKAHEGVLPLEVNRMLPYMVGGNWLLNYRQVEGIHKALTGMARRTPYDSKMDQASSDLTQHYDEYEREFNGFLPEVRSFAQEFIRLRPPGQP